jgi:hypothetical protein
MPTILRLLVPVVTLGVGVALLALPVGCRRPTPPGNVTVRGTITFEGQPLTGGLVVFSPDPDRGGTGKPIRGDVEADGTFQLKPGGETAIAPGWYRVAIAPATTDPPTFPRQLARPDQSGLIREVKPGQENVFLFAVEVSSK